jgi:hypothetical protein
MPFELAIDDQSCDVQTNASEAVVGYSVHFSLGAASACCANVGDPPTKVVSVRTAVISARRRTSRNLNAGLKLVVLCCFSNIGGSGQGLDQR